MNNTRIDYCYADPAGNITILVETALPVSDHPEVASRLLSLEPAAEQVGFIERVSGAGISMRMAGGEFCGNAAFSAAALAVCKNGTEDEIISVDFSGIDHPLSASIRRVSKHSFTGKIEMPFPEEISLKHLRFQEKEFLLPVVRFPGITHIICIKPVERTFAETALKQWCAELESPAAGIMLLDQETMSLAPLVYVSSPETLFWESSCASGTCAAAVWLSSSTRIFGTYSFSEPGGTLGAETGRDSVRLIDSVDLSFRSADK